MIGSNFRNDNLDIHDFLSLIVVTKSNFAAEEKGRQLREQLKQADELISKYDDMYYRQGGDPARMRQSHPGSSKPLRSDDLMRKNEVG